MPAMENSRTQPRRTSNASHALPDQQEDILASTIESEVADTTSMRVPLGPSNGEIFQSDDLDAYGYPTYFEHIMVPESVSSGFDTTFQPLPNISGYMQDFDISSDAFGLFDFSINSQMNYPITDTIPPAIPTPIQDPSISTPGSSSAQARQDAFRTSIW